MVEGIEVSIVEPENPQVSQANYLVQLLLLGDAGVGKSSLLHRFAEEEFHQNLVGTAGVDYKMKNIVLGGSSVKIKLWDTAGQERYRTLTRSYYKRAVGIVLVYDVTDEESFRNAEFWITQIRKHGESHVEILLVGNKIDLVNDIQVEKEEAETFAAQQNIQFMETSAKDSTNVAVAFKKLTSSILQNPNLANRIKPIQKQRIERQRTDENNRERKNAGACTKCCQ